MSVRQTLVFRRDLKVRRGKELAQAGHAAMAFMMDQIRDWYSYLVQMSDADFEKKLVEGVAPVQLRLNDEQLRWMRDKFTKIALVVDTEQQLRELHEKALAAGLVSHMIIDAGLTEFVGVPTLTCIAIGPHHKERIDPLTGHLKPY